MATVKAAQVVLINPMNRILLAPSEGQYPLSTEKHLIKDISQPQSKFLPDVIEGITLYESLKHENRRKGNFFCLFISIADIKQCIAAQHIEE